jgi:hypothetical protein
MKIRSTARAVLLLGAATLLVACGKQQATANESANAAVNAPATDANGAAPAATPAAAPGTLSADYMVGKWSAMDEDCTHTVEFNKDGTVTTPIGTAKWTIAGDKLSFDYGDGSKPTTSAIKVLGPDRIGITRESGGTETEKRCT